METIDIEHLVHWALATECAHRGARGEIFGGQTGSAHLIERIGVLGCRVQTSGAGTAMMGHTVNPDAEVVWSMIDGPLRALAPTGVLLVYMHGLAGTRPDWLPDARTRLEPRTWREKSDGKGGTLRKPVYDYHPDYRGGGQPWLCPLKVIDRPEQIRFARDQYLLWWGMLVHLVERLDGELAEFKAIGPKAHPSPWKGLDAAGNA